MKNKKTIIITSVILCLSLLVTGIFRFEQNKINQEAAKYEEKLSKEAKTLATIKQTTQKKVLQQAQEGDSVQKETAKQLEINQTISSKAEQLFQVLFTFSDSTEYNNHPKLVKDLVTPEVLANQRLFGSDKDVTGNSYIDTLKLKAQFTGIEVYSSIVESNEVSSIAKVSYSASKGDTQPGKREDIFQLLYDTNLGKFKEVKKIGTLEIQQD